MSDQEHGIPTGYRENLQSGNRTQVPPVGAYNTAQSRQLPEFPAPSQTSPTRSPPRKPVGAYERNPESTDSLAAPPPPPHRNGASSPSRYRHQPSTSRDQNIVAPGGGFLGVGGAGDSDQPYERDGQALRDIDNLSGSRMITPSPESDSASYQAQGASQPKMQRYSQSSTAPLSSHAAGMATKSSSPPRGIPAPGMLAYGYGYDSNMPSARSHRSDAYDAFVDPQDIAEDLDDGFEEQPTSRRNQFGAGAAAGASGAAVPSMLKAFGSRNPSYGQVPGGRNGDPEKSEWLRNNGGRSKRLKYIFGGLGVLIIIGIIAGVVGGIVATNPSSGGSDSSSSSSSSDSDSGNKYNINSPEVQALLHNKNLHKVFPAMDYTPLNGQYPACLTVPPDQNNVTLDVTMLSQLTPAIRLYGTDCDQTQMVLTAIDKLEMNDTMKVWLGVWLENNSTTNNRQLNQMYDILDTYDSSHFAGVIVGNEVLFREDMTEEELGQVLNTVRQKLVSKGIDLPVSTSDLGDNWTSALAADSDIVMSNVHPFFAGVKPDAAPGWTWEFWTTHDVILAQGSGGSYPKNIISETGWPSAGGNDCGTGYKCPTSTAGAIAGIDELNDFMKGWVCPSMANGTTFFW